MLFQNGATVKLYYKAFLKDVKVPHQNSPQ